MTVDTPAPPAESNDAAPVPLTRAEVNPARLRVLQGRYSGPSDIDGQLRLAAALAKARKAIPWQYRENPGDILAVIQQAVALDIQVTTALHNLVFSDAGVAGMYARLMHALIIRAGHEVMVTHHDDRICRMVLKRGDGRRGGGAQWTLAEANRAGLTTKDRSPWTAYSEDMLWARCLSRLARRYAPDVIAGFYAAEELDDIPADDELDSADTTTAMTSPDGEVVVAPDVEELLKDTDTTGMDPAEAMELLRGKWKEAQEVGLRGAYAGTVDGVMLTVKDYLYGRMADADARFRKAQDPQHVEPVDLSQVSGVLAAAAVAPDPEPVTGADAPAGTGRMACGCDSAAVLAADGRHQDSCTRPPRRPRRAAQ